MQQMCVHNSIKIEMALNKQHTMSETDSQSDTESLVTHSKEVAHTNFVLLNRAANKYQNCTDRTENRIMFFSHIAKCHQLLVRYFCTIKLAPFGG